MVSQSNTEIKVDISVGCMILKSDDIGLLFTYFKIEKKWRGAIENITEFSYSNRFSKYS